MAVASGCSLARSTAAAIASAASSKSVATTLGFPSVSVPVLSITRLSTFESTCNASAFLISTPAVAPLPVATITDMGVASPSAHGQAMIKTATALTRAWGRRGSGPRNIQAMKVTIATPITIGTNHAATTSASR